MYIQVHPARLDQMDMYEGFYVQMGTYEASFRELRTSGGYVKSIHRLTV